MSAWVDGVGWLGAGGLLRLPAERCVATWHVAMQSYAEVLFRSHSTHKLLLILVPLLTFVNQAAGKQSAYVAHILFRGALPVLVPVSAWCMGLTSWGYLWHEAASRQVVTRPARCGRTQQGRTAVRRCKPFTTSSCTQTLCFLIGATTFRVL